MKSNMNHPSGRRYQNQSPLITEAGEIKRWPGLHRDFRRELGFTLIKLMIAVAIVAILAAIAYPSYIEHVKRARRADAKTALLNDAQFLERNFTESNCYHKSNSTPTSPCNTAITLPQTQSPTDGAAIYTISATTLSATAYTLTATPVVGGPMAGDVCGNLTLSHLGVKGVGGSTVAECWNR